MRHYKDLDAVDGLDAARLFLELFRDRLATYATAPGNRNRSDESQGSKEAEMAGAEKELEKYKRRAADKERLMDECKKKYVLNLG